MALWNTDGTNPSQDQQIQRRGNGTIGSAHVVPSGINSTSLNKVINIFDPLIAYTGSWHLDSLEDSLYFLGYRAWSVTAGNSITLPFNGTSISVLGQICNFGALADVYIDGDLATGAVNTSTILAVNYYPSGLNATATTIALADASLFATSGSIYIDAEQVDYTGLSGNSLTGCTRGASGSIATAHAATTTVRVANSIINFYSPFFQNRIPVWSKRDLQPGNHTITIIQRSDTDPNAIGPSFFTQINAFVIGGMIGAQNINTVARYIEASCVFDTNGISQPLTFQPPDSSEQFLCIIGLVKQNDTTVPLGHLYDSVGGNFYITGPPSTSFTVLITTLNLGRSI